MAAHQITINPLSGGIGTAPAGVVPYASDMWGVNAVRVPQVGTPSARTQAKALTVGIAGRATTGDVSISFTSRLSPPAIVQAPQWGTATLSFPFTVEADSCPSRSAFGTAALATLRDVGIPSVAQLPALAGEPAIVSIATVTPGGYTRDTRHGLKLLAQKHGRYWVPPASNHLLKPFLQAYRLRLPQALASGWKAPRWRCPSASSWHPRYRPFLRFAPRHSSSPPSRGWRTSMRDCAALRCTRQRRRLFRASSYPRRGSRGF